MSLTPEQRAPGKLLKGVDHASYHSDDLPGAPHFSRSVAVNILASPLRAYTLHPRLGGAKDEEEEADPQRAARLEMGSLVHLLLLGAGQRVAIVDADSWRTNAAKDSRAEARSNGLLPVLVGKYEAAKATCTEIRRSLERYGIALAEYEAEVTALWESEGVPSKARLDLLKLATGDAKDLKVVERINLQSFDRGVLPFGLDIQAAAYTEAVESAHPEIAGRVSFEFLLVEKNPPYDVAILPLAPSKLGLGEGRWRRARSIWARCLKSGVWPGYGRQAPLEAKPWELEGELSAAVAAVGEPSWMKGETDATS